MRKAYFLIELCFKFCPKCGTPISANAKLKIETTKTSASIIIPTSLTYRGSLSGSATSTTATYAMLYYRGDDNEATKLNTDSGAKVYTARAITVGEKQMFEWIIE